MKLHYIILCASIPYLLVAQGSSSGNASSKLPVTPFVASTGSAFIADTGSIRSVIINPASIASGKNYSIIFAHTEWIQDIRTEYLSVMLPFKFGNFALSIRNTSIDGIQLHGNRPGPSEGTFNAQSTSFQLTYGTELTKSIEIGIAPKYLYEKIFVDDVTGYGIDLGLIYKPSIDKLLLGISLINIGKLSAFKEEKVDLPTQLNLGGSWSYSMDKFNFKMASALSKEINSSLNHLCFGLEAIYNNSISCRLGYKTGYEIQSLSAGIGIRYDFVNIEYAYLPFTLNAGNAHVFSFEFIL